MIYTRFAIDISDAYIIQSKWWCFLLYGYKNAEFFIIQDKSAAIFWMCKHRNE